MQDDSPSPPPTLDQETLDFVQAVFALARSARALLAHGADPELCNDRGQTPLAAAAFKGDLAMVRLLLQHGANVNVNGTGPDGKTALMMAAMFNRTDIVELLIAQGADPDARDASGMSALDAARGMGAADTPTQLARLAR